MTREPKPGVPPAHQVLDPSTGEHGVWGYTKSAVGGFGENYDAQVAHGEESDEPSPTTTEDSALEHAVRKSLAEVHVDAADVRVEVREAQVTLYGTVRKELERSRLEARARAVPGVLSVTSRLGVLDTASACG